MKSSSKFTESQKTGLYEMLKEINQDTFGDVYRFGWCEIKSNTKGDFYFSNYSGKRIYIN